MQKGNIKGTGDRAFFVELQGSVVEEGGEFGGSEFAAFAGGEGFVEGEGADSDSSQLFDVRAAGGCHPLYLVVFALSYFYFRIIIAVFLISFYPCGKALCAVFAFDSRFKASDALPAQGGVELCDIFFVNMVRG